jgi:hypothetical protein
MNEEMIVGILAILGFIWVLTEIGKAIARIIKK